MLLITWSAPFVSTKSTVIFPLTYGAIVYCADTPAPRLAGGKKPSCAGVGCVTPVKSFIKSDSYLLEVLSPNLIFSSIKSTTVGAISPLGVTVKCHTLLTVCAASNPVLLKTALTVIAPCPVYCTIVNVAVTPVENGLVSV